MEMTENNEVFLKEAKFEIPDKSSRGSFEQVCQGEKCKAS